MKISWIKVFQVGSVVAEQLMSSKVVEVVHASTAASSEKGKKVTLDEARAIIREAFSDIDGFLERLAQVLAD